MATGSFLFMQRLNRSLIVVLLSLALWGCSTNRKVGIPPVQAPQPAIPIEQEAPATSVSAKVIPKLGVVLGPGGARAQAHIGFLRELEKSQIEVVALSGIEWGSYVAALYSHKNKSNDIEWQISKLDSDFFEKKLLSSATKNISDLNSFFKNTLGSMRIEDGKSQFVCASTNTVDQQSSLIVRGLITDAMKYCLPYYPLLEPSGSWVAGVLDHRALLEYFRKVGVEYVVFVDVTSNSKPTFEKDMDKTVRVTWALALKAMQQSESAYNQVVRIDVRTKLNDFKNRKAQIQAGEAAGRKFVEQFRSEFNF